MLVLSPDQTDGLHLTLATPPTHVRERWEELLPEAAIAAIQASSHWDFGLCAKKVDELMGICPEDEITGALRRGMIASWLLELPRRIASYNLPPEVFEAYPYWLSRTAKSLSEDTGAYDADFWAKDVRFAMGLSVPGSRTHLID